eukprot:9262168-Lingulodinium_polyedra.AAC.1
MSAHHASVMDQARSRKHCLGVVGGLASSSSLAGRFAGGFACACLACPRPRTGAWVHECVGAWVRA